MMYSIEVIAAFDFLDREHVIGVLEYERLKGSASYRFSYDEDFLRSFPSFRLSSDIGNYPGWQSARSGIFSFLGDALPDRWGRALIDKRERIVARKLGRIPRTFDDFGYLVRIDDMTRMGALRFKHNGEYVGVLDDGHPVPPLASLETFIRDAHELERSEGYGTGLRDEWLDNVWRQGSSLGGARPKANVIEDNELWIAKIPSGKDTYDVALWEYFALTLARKAGVRTANSKVVRIGPTPYHTLLSKRFDRAGERRIQFASSLTLTGLRDGDNADSSKGYIDIAEAMAGSIGVTSLEENLEQLYRRIAYNIIIGNHDDHFRNHGFLLRKNGWELSPAYDINPTNMLTQSLMVSPHSNQSSLKELLDASGYYLIEKDKAAQIIAEVCSAVRGWREHASNVGINIREQQRFEDRIEYSLNEGRKVFI